MQSQLVANYSHNAHNCNDNLLDNDNRVHDNAVYDVDDNDVNDADSCQL